MVCLLVWENQAINLSAKKISHMLQNKFSQQNICEEMIEILYILDVLCVRDAGASFFFPLLAFFKKLLLVYLDMLVTFLLPHSSNYNPNGRSIFQENSIHPHYWQEVRDWITASQTGRLVKLVPFICLHSHHTWCKQISVLGVLWRSSLSATITKDCGWT